MLKRIEMIYTVHCHVLVTQKIYCVTPRIPLLYVKMTD